MYVQEKHQCKVLWYCTPVSMRIKGTTENKKQLKTKKRKHNKRFCYIQQHHTKQLQSEPHSTTQKSPGLPVKSRCIGFKSPRHTDTMGSHLKQEKDLIITQTTIKTKETSPLAIQVIQLVNTVDERPGLHS